MHKILSPSFLKKSQRTDCLSLRFLNTHGFWSNLRLNLAIEKGCEDIKEQPREKIIYPLIALSFMYSERFDVKKNLYLLSV